MIIESRGQRYKDCSISFTYKDEKKVFNSNSSKSLFKDIVDWLYKSGFEIDNFSKKIYSVKDIRNNPNKRWFHDIANSGNYISYSAGANQLFDELKKMLISFGVDEESIKINIRNDNKIKKFADLNDEPGYQEEPQSETTESYSENPFKQAICVLGESGAGKSHTIETILENEGHEFEFIIPTAATTGLLAQFSPTKSGYVPSRLGRMIIEAANNPNTLYTAVFDEMHKSSVIEMINDELLQCISIHRNNGVRFISLDDDTAELYNTPELEKRRGNIILPDNFGFIFISSKPRVIANNPDFFNRVDIVRLKHFEEESVESSDDLLSLVLDKDEKNKLISRRED